MQHRLFASSGAIEDYLPSRRIAVAVATISGEQAFDD
jgi:hypothetical protein